MSEPVQLNTRDTYDIGGVIVTLDEIQQAIIDQKCYQEMREILKGGK